MILPFDVQTRRSLRAQKIRIVVNHEQVEVVIPSHVSVDEAYDFVVENQAWVLKTLAKFKSRPALPLLKPERYQSGALIPYQGRQWPLVLDKTSLRRVKIAFDRQFNVAVPETLEAAEVEPGIRQALIKWLRLRARDQVQALVAKHQETFQLRPRHIRIKTQKSRWGSCGVHNDININWLLILAAPEVLEYVVVHELCHIRHRNHSARFWALVAAHLPEYQQQRRWLRENGAMLMQGL